MTQEKKREEIANYCVTKGILQPAAVDAEIKKMAEACPAATATEKGLTTDIDKAYETMLIEKGMTGSGSGDPTRVTPATPAKPTPTLSAEEQLQIAHTLMAQKADRSAVSANTSIEKLIFDRPAPAEWIPNSTKGIIAKTAWENVEKNIKDGKWRLLPDSDDLASTSNYNTLKAAAEAGTPVDVYIGKMNEKAIGYIVRKGNKTGTDAQEVQMTRAQFTDFLTLDAAGYVLSSGTKPGAKLRYVEPKNDPRDPGRKIAAKSLLVDANKKNAVEGGNFVVSKEVTQEKADTNLKTSLAFKVETDKKKQNGSGNIVRTVRVTCKASVPVITRKVEFADTFRDSDTKSNANLDTVPTGKVLEGINKAQKLAIEKLKCKMNDADAAFEVAEYQNKLAAFDVKPAAAPNSTAM